MMSMLIGGGDEAVVASHFFQDLGQAAQVAVGEVLRLPQVQDDPRWAGLGCEVVQVPEHEMQNTTWGSVVRRIQPKKTHHV